ncbi:signal peptide peptidase SppA [Flavobacterium caeni]|nr:signal peptide peptidase SppA [Flavobacterium caeni]
MRFLSNVLATLVGLFIFCMMGFFLLIFIAAIAGSGSDTVSVKDNSVIVLDLSRITNDYGGKINYKDIDYFEENHDGVVDILRAIEAAQTDPSIKGISILNNQSQLGMAQNKAIRDALEQFKQSGKFVYAYANYYTQKEYYLNSVANAVYLNPVGEMDFKGLSSEIMFFKDLQEKSGVKVEVIRHGKYKSAVEPFLDNKMSDANREQISALLQSVWDATIVDIAKSRNVPEQRLNEIANGLLARTPEMALAEKLVDKVVYEDVYHDDIRKKLKVDANEKYNQIDILDYAENIATTADTYLAPDKIAIIYAQGEIDGGEGDVTTIGEGSIRRSLQEARKDDAVKAIVLRIDSPGGSALTSDLIWREIELTKKEKPVVVSMGNLAASGGYYIACNSNRIFAEANTITGSIGVFGMLPNFTPLATKIGINTEQVSTHANAAGYSAFKPLSENFKNVTQESVERIYGTFVDRVAKGRKMTTAAVDSIGQGRVWSGSEALKIGLVDEIGGLDDAIAYAAKLAKTEDFATQDFPEYEKSFWDWLESMGMPFAKSRETVLREEIGEENYRMIQQIKRITAQKGVRAALPFGIDIR